MCVCVDVSAVTAAAAEVYFYDAVENVEDLCLVPNGDDDDGRLRQSTDPQLSRLQSRLVAICQRKASIRNRKVLESTLLFFVEISNLMPYRSFVVLSCILHHKRAYQFLTCVIGQYGSCTTQLKHHDG